MAMNFLKVKEKCTKIPFFSLQEVASLKWLDTVESLTDQIDVYIDRNLDVKEIEKGTICEEEYHCDILDLARLAYRFEQISNFRNYKPK